MVALRRRILAPAALAGSVLLGACILDFSDLASGGTGGAASASSTGGSHAGTGGGDAGPGDAGCPLLDCSCGDGPIVVASGAPFATTPVGLVVTADGLFWVDEIGAVVHAPAAGGAIAKLTDAAAPRAIGAAGDDVVWTADQGLFACKLPSCGASAHQVAGAAATGSVRNVAFDGLTVVWTDVGAGPNSGKVLTCALAGCAPLSLADSMLAPAGVDIAGDSALWVDKGNGNQNGNVVRSPKSTQSPSQIASGRDLPAGITGDDTYVWWTESNAAGHVLRCAANGGPCNAPEDIAPAAGGLPLPYDVRLSGSRVYWTNIGDGSIRSCPLPGCAAEMPKVHVTGRPSIQRLAVGASCLFWTEDGAVMKIAR